MIRLNWESRPELGIEAAACVDIKTESSLSSAALFFHDCQAFCSSVKTVENLSLTLCNYSFKKMCKKREAVFVFQADSLGFLSSVVTNAARFLMYYGYCVPNCVLLSYILNIWSALVSKSLSWKCSALFAHSKRSKKNDGRFLSSTYDILVM